MMGKHTKGPWVAVEQPDDGGDYSIYGGNIAVAISIGGTFSEKANAIRSVIAKAKGEKNE